MRTTGSNVFAYRSNSVAQRDLVATGSIVGNAVAFTMGGNRGSGNSRRGGSLCGSSLGRCCGCGGINARVAQRWTVRTGKITQRPFHSANINHTAIAHQLTIHRSRARARTSVDQIVAIGRIWLTIAQQGGCGGGGGCGCCCSVSGGGGRGGY